MFKTCSRKCNKQKSHCFWHCIWNFFTSETHFSYFHSYFALVKISKILYLDINSIFNIKPLNILYFTFKLERTCFKNSTNRYPGIGNPSNACWSKTKSRFYPNKQTNVTLITFVLIKEWIQLLPKLYEYNIDWGSLRFINREAVYKNA